MGMTRRPQEDVTAKQGWHGGRKKTLPQNRDDLAPAGKCYRKPGGIRRPQKMIQRPFTHHSPCLLFLLFIILLKSSVIRCIIVEEIY